jgi:hypothetical protein
MAKHHIYPTRFWQIITILIGLTPVTVKMVWADAIAASNKNEVSKVRFFLCGG